MVALVLLMRAHEGIHKLYHSDEEVKNGVTNILKEKPKGFLSRGYLAYLKVGKQLSQKVATITDKYLFFLTCGFLFV